MSRVRRGLIAVALAGVAVAGCSKDERTWSWNGERGPLVDGQRLVTGKYLSAATQPAQAVGSFPINLALTPDGKYAISTDVGYYQWLWAIRTSDGRGVSKVDYSNKMPIGSAPAGGEANAEFTHPGSPQSVGLYYGLAVSADNRTVYAAQGEHDTIAVLDLSPDGKLAVRDSIKARHADFPAGIALDAQNRLYVSNNSATEDDPFKLTASVAVYDVASKRELGRYSFSDSHGGTSNFPMGIAVLRDGSRAFVASERDDAVYILDTRDPANPRLSRKVTVGAHPVAVLLSRDEKRLYVSNSLSDTVTAIDVRSEKPVGTALLRPKVVRDVPGVTPLGLALSPDQKTLYTACADMNAVAVINTASMELRGFTPAGWYPTAVAATPDGKRILVANAKGGTAQNPNNRVDPHDPKRKTAAHLSILEGAVVGMEAPAGESLERSTAQVLKDNRLDALSKSQANPLKSIGLASGNIKHVFYIIKENRTYDQVLGDLPQGNGDKALCLFPRKVTPNQHALAERFVLLDNLYACGEVSGDGWCWSTQGMANAYVQRNVPYSYSHRGRKFDYEGSNNAYPTGGFPRLDLDGKPLSSHPAFTKDSPAIPDVGSTNRNLWDAAREAKVSVRNYGFFLYFADHLVGIPGGPDNYPAAPGLLPWGHDLEGVTDADFKRFDMDYADSDAPSELFKKTGDRKYLYPVTGYGKYDAPSRFAEWNREFQMMLKKDPTGGAVPNLVLIRLPMNHAVGAKGGKHTPSAYVADNDYGLGQIVESISKSPIWKNSAIFVIEDDCQSGVDHVDAHRTLGFVISPWMKANSVDHRFYNTDSMLKTMELLLGLKPLCQYDAVADPILNWDTTPANNAPYEAVMPDASIFAQVNPKASALRTDDPRRALAVRSEKMDFTHADAAPADDLDVITWKTVHGADSRPPVLRRSFMDRDDD